MTKTYKNKRRKNKSKRRQLKKRGGNADLGNLFINSNPLTTFSQMIGITK
jgi:hypothetical protein